MPDGRIPARLTVVYPPFPPSCLALGTAIGRALAAASPIGSKPKTTWRNVTLSWHGVRHAIVSIVDVHETAFYLKL